jgi:hypothetical protein
MTILSESKADLSNNSYNRVEMFKFVPYGEQSIKRPQLNLPQYTTAERDALTDPLTGEVIYNTTTNKINFYAAAAWEAVTSS